MQLPPKAADGGYQCLNPICVYIGAPGDGLYVGSILPISFGRPYKHFVFKEYCSEALLSLLDLNQTTQDFRN